MRGNPGMFSFFKKRKKGTLQAFSLVLSFSLFSLPAITHAFPHCPSEGSEKNHFHQDDSHSGKNDLHPQPDGQSSDHHASHSHFPSHSEHSSHDHPEKMAGSSKGHSHSDRDPGACCRAPFPSHFILSELPAIGSGKIEGHHELTSISFIPHEASLSSFLGTYTHYGTDPPPSLQGFSHFLQTTKILC